MPQPELSEARRRVLDALAGRAAPATVGDLAAELGGHPNGTRHHLDALTAEGLADVRPLPSAGRGRPRRGYAVTRRGRGVLRRDAADRDHYELVQAVAAHLAAGPDPGPASRAIGRTWGRERAASLSAEEPRAAVLEMLDALGFEPQGDASGREVRLLACPMLDTARAHPDVMCEIHRGLIEGVLGARGADAEGVRLVPFAAADACRVDLA